MADRGLVNGSLMRRLFGDRWSRFEIFRAELRAAHVLDGPVSLHLVVCGLCCDAVVFGLPHVCGEREECRVPGMKWVLRKEQKSNPIDLGRVSIEKGDLLRRKGLSKKVSLHQLHLVETILDFGLDFAEKSHCSWL